jgi:hypothetical protein
VAVAHGAHGRLERRVEDAVVEEEVYHSRLVGVGVHVVNRDAELLGPDGLGRHGGDVEVDHLVLRPGDLLVVDLGTGTRLVGDDEPHEGEDLARAGR